MWHPVRDELPTGEQPMRRRHLPWSLLVLGAVLVAALGALLVVLSLWAQSVSLVPDRSENSDNGTTVSRGSSGPPPSDAQRARPWSVPADAQPAIVVRVVDGDTIRVVTDPTTDANAGSTRVRFLNIDAPELARDGRPDECGAVDARDRLAELVEPGDVIWMAGDVEDRDIYDRPLRAIWDADGTFVNRLLAREGWVTPLHIPPNDRFLAEIQAAFEQAELNRDGLFAIGCDIA